MTAVTKGDTLSSLDQLTWKNRVILVWTDHPEPVKDTLERARPEIDERDIFWFIFSDDEVLTNYSSALAADFADKTTRKYQSGNAKVLLIGKDGGVKESDTELLLDALFREIDAMPMRIREMRQHTQ